MTFPGLEVRSYWVQKLGADRSECEDALSCNLKRRAFAIADGATEAFDSRYWAQLLARSWVRQDKAVTREAFLEMARQLGEHAGKRWAKKRLSWYAEEKARAGSFAAFIGLLLQPCPSGLQWQSIAIGDCCLMQLRDGELILTVPFSSPADFGFRPTLLPSRISSQPAILDEIKEYRGEAEHGDVFLMLSDAIASWFLQAFNDNRPSAMQFEALLRDNRISQLDIFVDEQRSAEMRNDDIAAIHIQIV